MSKTIEAPQLQRGQLELTRQQEQSKDLQGLDVAPFALAEPLAVAIERLQSEGQGQRAVDGSQTGEQAGTGSRSGTTPQGGNTATRQAAQSDVAGQERTTVKVMFAGEGEPVDPARLGAERSVVLVAHVVGDQLMAFARQERRPDKQPTNAPRDVLVRRMPAAVGDAAEVTLRHPDLGRLSLTIELKGNQLDIRAQLGSVRAADVMQRAAAGLRHALRELGLTLNTFEIAGPSERSRAVARERLLDEEA